MSDAAGAAAGTDAGAAAGTDQAAAGSEPAASSILTDAAESLGGGANGGTQGAGAQSEAQPGSDPTAADPAAAAANAAGATDYTGVVMPEGFVVDEQAMGELSPVLQQFGVTQEGAQQLVDLYCKQVAKQHDAEIDRYNETRTGWENDLKNDPDIGGQKLAENLSFGVKVLQQFGNPELVEFLKETGIGSYKPFVRMMVDIGKKYLTSDSMTPAHAQGAGAAAPQKSDAQILFPVSVGGQN